MKNIKIFELIDVLTNQSSHKAENLPLGHGT